MEQSWVAQTTPVTSRRTSYARESMDEYRRQRADEAIAYIERCYRERRAIPNVR